MFSDFLFYHNSVMVSCKSLGIHTFLLDYPIYWDIIFHSVSHEPLYFCGTNCNIFTPEFGYLYLLSFVVVIVNFYQFYFQMINFRFNRFSLYVFSIFESCSYVILCFSCFVYFTLFLFVCFLRWALRLADLSSLLNVSI